MSDLSRLLEPARHTSARTVNIVKAATFWGLGRRIVEFEQGGAKRAGYDDELLVRLAKDLTARRGRGYSLSNLKNSRTIYLLWPIGQTASGELRPASPAPTLPLAWSQYGRLMAVKNELARRFYKFEPLRDGWSVRRIQSFERLRGLRRLAPAAPHGVVDRIAGNPGQPRSQFRRFAQFTQMFPRREKRLLSDIFAPRDVAGRAVGDGADERLRARDDFTERIAISVDAARHEVRVGHFGDFRHSGLHTAMQVVETAKNVTGKCRVLCFLIQLVVGDHDHAPIGEDADQFAVRGFAQACGSVLVALGRTDDAVKLLQPV